MKNKPSKNTLRKNFRSLVLAGLVCLPVTLLKAGADPIAHWPMDKIEKGGVLADKKGDHDVVLAELEGFTPQNVSGVVGDALLLEADQQGYAEVTGGRDLRFPDGLTVSAWIRPSSRDQLGDIITCRYDVPDATAGWRLRYGYGQVFFEAVDSSGQTVRLESDADAVQAKHWVHVAATVSENDIRLYLNGTEVAKAPFAGPLAEPTPPIMPLIIGNHATIASYRHDKCPAFGGAIDEVKIFDRPLTKSELVKESNP
jgi:hypothetical protein